MSIFLTKCYAGNVFFSAAIKDEQLKIKQYFPLSMIILYKIYLFHYWSVGLAVKDLNIHLYKGFMIFFPSNPPSIINVCPNILLKILNIFVTIGYYRPCLFSKNKPISIKQEKTLLTDLRALKLELDLILFYKKKYLFSFN